MDKIIINELEVFAHHGVYKEEKEKGQAFFVNAVLYTDLRPAGKSDDLALSTDYGRVCQKLRESLTTHAYDLIERAAQEAAQALLLEFPRIHALDLELRKPHAPVPMKFQSISVKIHRGWHTAYVALGSNLGDSRQYIEDALDALQNDSCNKDIRISSLITSKPYGGIEQPDFLNGVAEIRTLYTPKELLEALHKLENKAGRTRQVHWGPRTLDLDILFYDDLVMDTETLTIPHGDMQNRDFVLGPMAELAPWFRHPLLKKTMREMLEKLGEKGTGGK